MAYSFPIGDNFISFRFGNTSSALKMLKSPIVDLEKLVDLLPQGSGINSEWNFEMKKNGNIVCSNSYQLLNENGYYEGWQGFKVHIYKKDKVDFRVTLDAPRSKKNSAYQLKDYLEETVSYSLESIIS